MQFWATYIKDPLLDNHINAIRLLCDPQVKHPAHITIRGPHHDGITKDKIKHMSQSIQNKDAYITGMGGFSRDDKSAVFLRCDSLNLREIYREYRSPAYKPQLTLYEGPSKDLANQLSYIARNHPLSICFQTEGLEPLTEDTLNRNFEFPTSFVLQTTGREIHAHDLRLLTEEDRLSLVEDIMESLEQMSTMIPAEKMQALRDYP